MSSVIRCDVTSCKVSLSLSQFIEAGHPKESLQRERPSTRVRRLPSSTLTPPPPTSKWRTQGLAAL